MSTDTMPDAQRAHDADGEARFREADRVRNIMTAYRFRLTSVARDLGGLADSLEACIGYETELTIAMHATAREMEGRS